MRDQIATALKNHGVQYVEIRLEQNEGTYIRYRGDSLEDLGKISGVGGNVRVLDRGGWGFASFNDLTQLREKVTTAVSHARHVGGGSISLAEIEPRMDVVPLVVRDDPKHIPLEEKKNIISKYADILLGVPGVRTCNVGYNDGWRKTILATSEGTYIEQQRVDVNLRMSAIASENGDVQQSGVSLGSNGDFSFVRSLHDKAQELGRRAGELLRAPNVKGGNYTVLLDPVLAGVFIHEAFGHLSEADHLYEDKRLQKLMRLGKRFGDRHLNVIDGASVPGLRGSYKYDDEGTPATRTHLIQEGELVGRLHSRETAAKMNEQPSGNARAINHNFPPIVRMTNTFIEPGSATFDDLIADIKEGVYACNWYGGMTSMEMFTFSAGEAYMIRNGKVAELLRPVMLTGNLFSTLKSLDGIGNDLSMNQGGGCGKGGQSPLPVSNGSPHIRIQNCLVGGT